MSPIKILVAVDFTPASQAAVECAAVLAQQSGGRLIVAHVDERLPAYRVAIGYSGVVEPGLDDLVKKLVAVVPSDPAITTEHRLLLGDPVIELLQLAREELCDLIVVGSHGQNPVRKWLLGSVAEGVLRSAPCAVIVYRPPLDSQGPKTA
jgi:universal stress protein A